MSKKISILVFFALFLIQPFSVFAEKYSMPILEKTPVGIVANAPIENRGAEYKKFLSASVKISVNNTSGSGTIVYYDELKNVAYIASCGHLWGKGFMSAEQLKVNPLRCKIIVWYKNDQKLDYPKSYDASVVFYSYLEGQDTSLITFVPDWKPHYIPIGPENYEYKVGKSAHSCGSDLGSEVAHYDIEMLGIIGYDLVTQKNSPRPGRSGGGLMDDNGNYIGTCWGTQYQNGTGRGYFTPLSVIHRYWGQQKGYEFLLRQSGLAQKIPIINRNEPQIEFPIDYVVLPK
jgi:hypothetical protein